ncbi:MAG TPA: hypothetical protein VFB67_02470 [Candidatus Polarisedimenticolaceae bacterium]|nr:hypothetical protein [Candidatus Polarisedimenticolaceae bacterium]
MQELPMRPTFLSLALLSAVTAVAAVAPGTSHRFGYSTFREDAGRLVVFVDGYPASVGGDEAYVPIPLAVALVKSGGSLTFTPESFTLIDRKGNSLPAAGFREVTEGHGRMEFERSLMRMRPIVVATWVTELPRIPSRFFPAPSSGTRIPRVHLAPQSWFRDVVYFPRPPAGLSGTLTLRVDVAGAAPVEVRFAASPDELAKR